MNLEIARFSFITGFGTVFGWFVGEFYPTFPLIIIAILLILFDSWTAYQLSKRVHKKYPTKAKRKQIKFNSFDFSKVIKDTIPKRLFLILIAYSIEHWIFNHQILPLSYVAAGTICFEQLLSILENESSCRDEKESRLWRFLKRMLVDKSERHFDVDLKEFKDNE